MFGGCRCSHRCVVEGYLTVDALLQQRAEDQITAALESNNIEVVQHTLTGLVELQALLAEGTADVLDHLTVLRKRTTRLPLGID